MCEWVITIGINKLIKNRRMLKNSLSESNNDNILSLFLIVLF